jgi:hypothetical protein
LENSLPFLSPLLCRWRTPRTVGRLSIPIGLSRKKPYWIYFLLAASHSLGKGLEFPDFSIPAKAFPTLDVMEVPPKSPASNFSPLGGMHDSNFSKEQIATLQTAIFLVKARHQRTILE